MSVGSMMRFTKRGQERVQHSHRLQPKYDGNGPTQQSRSSFLVHRLRACADDHECQVILGLTHVLCDVLNRAVLDPRAPLEGPTRAPRKWGGTCRDDKKSRSHKHPQKGGSTCCHDPRSLTRAVAVATSQIVSSPLSNNMMDGSVSRF